MKMKNLRLFILLLLFSSCQETETIQLDLKGSMKGKIYTLNELGLSNNDNENISIRLEGSEPLLETTTDIEGKYEIDNIPSGTYNIILSKDGYGSHQIQGMMIVGGDEPIYLNYALFEKSKTTIEDLSIEISDNIEVLIKGIVYHNFIEYWDTPTIRYFIHNENNVSSSNYIKTGTIYLDGASGEQMESNIYIYSDTFKTGDVMYVIAYGCYGQDFGYYDILSNKNIYTSLGEASNIASIVFP